TDRDDEEEEEPSGDEADDEEDEDNEEEEEEEEHPAPADSIPPPIHRVTARISIRAQTPIPSPPLLVSPPLPISPPPTAGPTYPLGYRAAMIRLRAEALSTSHSLPLPPPIILSRTRSDSPPSGTPLILHIPLPTSSPSLLLPPADHGADRPRVCLPPWKRLCIALGLRYEVEESSSAPTARPTGGFRADYGFVAILDREIRRDPERYVSYGITDTWDEMLEDIPRELTTNETELGWRMTNFVTTVRHDTYEIYVRLGKTQDDRSLMSHRLNLLQRDRCAHAHIALLMKREARISCEAWGRSMDASDLARSKVMELRTQVVAQQSEITALRAADRARQTQLVETLRLMSILQTHVTALQGQLRPASGLAQPKIPEEADSSVTDALAARDADRNMNGDDNHNSGTGVRRTERVARECTYPDFKKCEPLNFKGTEGVFELIQWTVGHDVAYAMTWTDLKKKITDKYCSRVEIKKLEVELWKLKVKGTDVIGYNQHFQELALLCVRMFLEESSKIERYVGGFPDMIHGCVVASKPKTMQEAIEIATELMDKKIRTFVER
ncbi:putative reverse transcriptase domain-containing protein, partial [Tanacetum coccineum]